MDAHSESCCRILWALQKILSPGPWTLLSNAPGQMLGFDTFLCAYEEHLLSQQDFATCQEARFSSDLFTNRACLCIGEYFYQVALSGVYSSPHDYMLNGDLMRACAFFPSSTSCMASMASRALQRFVAQSKHGLSTSTTLGRPRLHLRWSCYLPGELHDAQKAKVQALTRYRK